MDKDTDGGVRGRESRGRWSASERAGAVNQEQQRPCDRRNRDQGPSAAEEAEDQERRDHA
jgi:hypothetical protein